MSNQVRSFKLERIDRVKVLSVQYRLPPDFSLADHLRDSWGIWSSDPPRDVVLRFRPPAARRVAESNWHPSQQLRHLEDGSVELTIRVRGTVEIMPWIQGWGPEVEVLAPAQLREAVASRAHETAARYSGPDAEKATG
jgi:predicted DNA-binding transcriptional regulator YafY